jgi:hypothetical protein
VEIYYAHQLALSLLMAFQWEVVRRTDLTTEGLTPAVRRALPFRRWGLSIACLAALVAAVFHTEWAQGVFAFGVVGGRILSRRWKPAEV